MTTYTIHNGTENKDAHYKSVRGLKTYLKAFAERRQQSGDGIRLTIRYDVEQDNYDIYIVGQGSDTRGYQSARQSIYKRCDGTYEVMVVLTRTLPTGDEETASIYREPAVGDRIYTPRFCTVTIAKVFPTMREAEKEGYVHSAHLKGIYGKSLDEYHMRFAFVAEAD